MLFKPHPEIPNHYTVSSDHLLRTDDLSNFDFNWSRVLHDNYIEDQGYLAFHGDHRVLFHGFRYDPSHSLQYISSDYIKKELEKITIPNKLNIIHYFPDGEINCIITGIEPAIFKDMRMEYKNYYYDFT